MTKLIFQDLIPLALAAMGVAKEKVNQTMTEHKRTLTQTELESLFDAGCY